MFNRLTAAAGLDRTQLVALVRAFLKRDLRQASVSPVLRQSRSGGRTLLSLVFFYFLIGLSFLPTLAVSENLVPSVALLLTYAMVMVGSLILIEYHTVVLSPQDYQVLAYRPLAARTFFCAKVVNLVLYLSVFTCALALPSVILLLLDQDVGAAIGLFLATLAATCAVCFLIVLLYATILEKVDQRRLQSLLSWFQVILALVIYSGFFVMPWMVNNLGLRTEAVSNSSWLFFYPPTWFASYVAIAAGQASLLHWGLSLGSVLLVALLAVLAVQSISSSFSESLAGLATSENYQPKEPSRKSRIPRFLVLSHEERVVARLILKQFMHDNKFKMAVLGILPLTVFYVLLGTQHGPLYDPFRNPVIEFDNNGFLYLLIFLFPMMLRTYVTQSDSHLSSWIFYALPVDIRKVVLAEKTFLMLYFVLPFLLVLTLLFVVFFKNLEHVLLHMLVLGLLAHFFLQLGFVYSPDLPFSRPNVRGQRTRHLSLFLVLIPFLVYLGLPLVFKYIYTNWPAYIVFVGAILLLTLLLEQLIKLRINNFMNKAEFMG